MRKANIGTSPGLCPTGPPVGRSFQLALTDSAARLGPVSLALNRPVHGGMRHAEQFRHPAGPYLRAETSDTKCASWRPLSLGC